MTDHTLISAAISGRKPFVIHSTVVVSSELFTMDSVDVIAGMDSDFTSCTKHEGGPAIECTTAMILHTSSIQSATFDNAMASSLLEGFAVGKVVLH